MNLRRYSILLFGLVVVPAALVAVWFFSRPAGIVEISGLVRGTELTVSSRISGKIELLSIQEGQEVAKGDLIARLSSKEFEATLEQAEGSVETASHRIHQAKESIKGANALVQQAEVRLEQAKKDSERYARLLDKGVVSRKAYEDMQTRLRIAEAGLDAAKDAREAKRAALQTAEAALSVARGREKEALARLEKTRIHAPAEGTVMNKFVEQGELVSPGAPLALIIDLHDIHAKVYVSEVDIGRIKIGAPARIFTDAFPDRYFTGRIVEISQQAEFTPKEVHVKEERTKFVFGVKVGIDNPQGYLKPGLPVDVKIKWSDDVAW